MTTDGGALLPPASMPSRGARDSKWLRMVAYSTWLVCGVMPLADIATGRFGGAPALGWFVAFVVFGVALVLSMQPPHWLSSSGRTVHLLLLAVQSVAGLTMVAFTGTLASATLVMVAAETPYVLPFGGGWMVVAGQTVLLGVVASRFGSWRVVVTATLAIGAFQMFALASSLLARRERTAREELGRTNDELVATRARLAENTRNAERLRIARDLHDTLGHHLTALSLQLDVASRLVEGKGADHVTEAYGITRLLLSDVRNVVSEMREGSRADLAEAVRALALAPGDLAIHLDLPAPLVVDDAGRADALLRGVQEIITNTSRHAAAGNLWIRIEALPDSLSLHGRDDGRGCDHIVAGNGLRGMRERFEEHGGHVDVLATVGHGFEVRASMPAAPAGAS